MKQCCAAVVDEGRRVGYRCGDHVGFRWHVQQRQEGDASGLHARQRVVQRDWSCSPGRIRGSVAGRGFSWGCPCADSAACSVDAINRSAGLHTCEVSAARCFSSCEQGFLQVGDKVQICRRFLWQCCWGYFSNRGQAWRPSG